MESSNGSSRKSMSVLVSNVTTTPPPRIIYFKVKNMLYFFNIKYREHFILLNN